MNQSEFPNQTPLLLRYKLRERFNRIEAGFDPNAATWTGDWTEYEEPGYEMWKLKLPDNQGFLTNSNGTCLTFTRYEIYAIGDGIPIVLGFNWLYYSTNNDSDEFRIGLLPDEYDMDSKWNFNDHMETVLRFRRKPHLPRLSGFLSNIRPLLHQYERHRGTWTPRIVIGRDEK